MKTVKIGQQEDYSVLTKKCLEFLAAEGGKETSIGIHRMEDGSGIYFIASEGNTKDPSDLKWEAHRKYVDLQVSLLGEEVIRIAPLTGMQVLSYDENRDFVACEGETAEEFLLNAENAVYLFPEDAHMPGISPDGTHGAFKKVCFKIPAGLF